MDLIVIKNRLVSPVLLLLCISLLTLSCSRTDQAPPHAKSTANAKSAMNQCRDNGAKQVYIGDGWVRSATRGRSMSAGYPVICAPAGQADTLLNVSSTAARATELHETQTDAAGNNTMRAVNSVVISENSAVTFKPGGLHIMFIGLKAPLAEGDTVPVTFTFENAGDIVVDLAVSPDPNRDDTENRKQQHHGS